MFFTCNRQSILKYVIRWRAFTWITAMMPLDAWLKFWGKTSTLKKDQLRCVSQQHSVKVFTVGNTKHVAHEEIFTALFIRSLLQSCLFVFFPTLMCVCCLFFFFLFKKTRKNAVHMWRVMKGLDRLNYKW